MSKKQINAAKIKAAKAERLGARRVALIKRQIMLDAKMDKLRDQHRSLQFKIDNVDRVINNLGFGGISN